MHQHHHHCRSWCGVIVERKEKSTAKRKRQPWFLKGENESVWFDMKPALTLSGPLAAFTQSYHNFLFQVCNREALETLIPARRFRGWKKLDAFTWKPPWGAIWLWAQELVPSVEIWLEPPQQVQSRSNLTLFFLFLLPPCFSSLCFTPPASPFFSPVSPCFYRAPGLPSPSSFIFFFLLFLEHSFQNFLLSPTLLSFFFGAPRRELSIFFFLLGSFLLILNPPPPTLHSALIIFCSIIHPPCSIISIIQLPPILSLSLSFYYFIIHPLLSSFVFFLLLFFSLPGFCPFFSFVCFFFFFVFMFQINNTTFTWISNKNTKII